MEASSNVIQPQRGNHLHADEYRGTAEQLIAAGIATYGQLTTPQKGRCAGYAIFLPDGSPCPLSARSWREPGYKIIREQEDGTFVVEITVSIEEQRKRRAEQKERARERDELELNRRIVDEGQQVRERGLKHHVGSPGSDFERWEGTKAQLQAAGIGVGLAFPGEPGAPACVLCTCPLGFEVEIRRAYDALLAEAGIYDATSFYVRREERKLAQYAPGVLQQVSGLSWRYEDTFIGTAEALVAAKLAADLTLFPGQPGRNKVQCTYRNVSRLGRRVTTLTIRRAAKGRFELSIPVSDEEGERRRAIQKERDGLRESEVAKARAERMRLRGLASEPENQEAFRAERIRSMERWLTLIWSEFNHKEGLYGFEVDKESEAYESIADGFDSIRNAFATAQINCDSKLAKASLQRHQAAQEARRDVGLQTFLNALTRAKPDKDGPSQ